MKWSDLLQWEGSSLSQQAQVYDKNVESLKSASESLDANLSSLTGQGKPSVRLPGSSTAPPRTTPSTSDQMDPFSTWVRTTCLQQMR